MSRRLRGMPDTEQSYDDPLQMTISLSALDDLGINLYSTIPAVLSEVVANAYDADAASVWIDLNGDHIVIRDDGHGMNRRDVNQRFLEVGYKRRDDGRTHSPLGRPVMGRKGIGKLSLFAVADTVIVQTVAVTGRCHFSMNSDDIRRAIKETGSYFPEELDATIFVLDGNTGTRIILRDLKSVADGRAAAGMRKRIARRFSILGPAFGFEINLDDESIGIQDRGYWPFLQYAWPIGSNRELVEERASKADKVFVLENEEDLLAAGVSGWVGSVFRPKQLDPEGPGIPVLARGKLIHEDLLTSVPHGGLFTKYLTGEISADFIDVDEEADIATSDRQSLKESDPQRPAARSDPRSAGQRRPDLGRPLTESSFASGPVLLPEKD